MLATQITNHVQAALNRLMQQYRGKVGLEAFLSALVTQIQELEAAIYGIDQGRQLYNGNAQGVQLDGIGELVGVPRNGLDDAEYLVFILATIGENTSDTTITKVIAIILLIFGAQSIVFDEIFPAAIGFQLGSPTLDPSLYNVAIDLIINSLGAAIGIGYVSTYTQGESFSFLNSPGKGKGFTRVGSPPGTGGIFSRVVYNNLDV